MTTSTLERPTTQGKQVPPKETTDLRIPVEWLQAAPAPAPAKPTPPERHWPTYFMIGLVAALIGLILGAAVATLYREHQINDLKAQLAAQVTISQIAPGNGPAPWRAPDTLTGTTLGQQVAPTSLLTRPAPAVFTRTLGRQVAPLSLLTRAAPLPPSPYFPPVGR